MEGKNCFRTRWTQEPIFSGGNIASLALPRRSFDHLRSCNAPQEEIAAAASSSNNKDRHALPEYDECLVMACGDTINVVRAATGELVCNYTLPVEDVILTVDAVSVLSEEQYRSFGQAAMARNPTTAATTSGLEKDSEAKRDKKASKKEVKAEISEEQAPTGAAEDERVNPELAVPMGCYIACGTRSLQLYMFHIAITEMVPLAADEKNKKKDGNEEEVEEDGADASSPSPDVEAVEPIVGYELRALRNWTAAQQAISLVSFSNGGQFLISGSTDGGIKVWNAFHHHLTHNFRCPSGSLLQTVHLDPTESFLVTGSFEGHITVFDFVEKVLLAHSRPHVHAVDAITLSEDGSRVLSIGRDRRISIQALAPNGLTGKKRAWTLTEERAIVVKEHVSAALFESPTTLHIGSMDGVLTTYRIDPDSTSGAAVTVLCRNAKPPSSNAEDANEETMIKCLVLCDQAKGSVRTPTLRGFRVETSSSLASSAGRTALYVVDAGYNVAKFVFEAERNQYVCVGTLVGFLDQILDIKLFAKNTPRPNFPYERIIVNNSKDVRLYGTDGCLSGQVLQGHADVVLCCAISTDGSLIATGGKDKEVRFWSTTTWQTVALGVRGHTAEITSLCFNAKQTESYFLLFTISADENLRVWDVGQNVLPALKKASQATSTTARAISFENKAGINAAHTGAVFALAVAPNDQYVATGGKDKTINLWNITGKKVFKDATLKGHRRGISSLAFSPADRVLASAANDGSVRLWSLVSLTCVKALQVDKVAVLQVAFFNQGTQIVTGNAEGVLRVWAVAASEAVWASESHHEKVWALNVIERESGETLFLTGAADGVLMATEDYTAEEVARVKQDRHEVILKEQALTNAIRRGEFSDAFLLALQLNHPRHLRQVLVRWCAVDAAQCEETMKRTLLPRLSDDHIVRLLQFTREWITNSRHCMVASLVIYAFLGSQHFHELAQLPAMQSLVEPLLAYSQRHSQRQHDLLRRTYYIDYVAQAGVITSSGQKTLTTMPPFVNAEGKRLLPDTPAPPSKTTRAAKKVRTA